MSGGIDRDKTLEEIESDVWDEPTFQSHLVMTCHRLRRKHLSQFTIEDLRIMIGQQISLPILVPLALDHLEVDPLAEGDHYAGDLISAVLRANKTFWASHPDCYERTARVIGQIRALQHTLDECDGQTVRELLEDVAQHESFRSESDASGL